MNQWVLSSSSSFTTSSSSSSSYSCCWSDPRTYGPADLWIYAVTEIMNLGNVVDERLSILIMTHFLHTRKSNITTSAFSFHTATFSNVQRSVTVTFARQYPQKIRSTFLRTHEVTCCFIGSPEGLLEVLPGGFSDSPGDVRACWGCSCTLRVLPLGACSASVF